MTKFLQDILNEPAELTKTLAHTLGNGRGELARAARIMNAAPSVYITGIGSSWHAGMAVLSRWCAAGCAACLLDASDAVHFARIPAGSAVPVLSRSGESVEIVQIVQIVDAARSSGASIIAITNTPDSSLARQADVVLRMEAAFDHNVSVTMYTGVALVGALLVSEAMGAINADLAITLKRSLAACGPAIEEWRRLVQANDWFVADEPAYFLARGPGMAAASESRLLWEEAAKTPATALTTGGFRHGPQEMLRPGMRVGIWLDSACMRVQDLALAADVRRLGASVMVIGQNLPRDAADLRLELPAITADWQFLTEIMPAQVAAEHQSHVRGVDCDTFGLCPYIVNAEGGL